MVVPFAALALGSQLFIAVADTVPNLKVEQTCRAQGARTDALGGSQGALGGTVESCLRSEQTARDKLRTEWGQFTAADRTRCTATSTMGGEPSYVELLTCLETTKQARELQAGSDTMTGQATKRAK
jgi:hypothetical protein